MITDVASIQRHGDPLTAELDSEIVMFDPAKGSYFSLGVVGSRVWELLAEPRSIDSLCAQLVDEFEIDGPTCRQEIHSFVDQLFDAELVKLAV